MRRFSILWWLAVLPTSALAGAATLVALGFAVDWGLAERLVTAAVAALMVEFGVAVWMERYAPTRVTVGPGEKLTRLDDAFEEAVVTGGFDASAHGQVRVRGEEWPAVCTSHDAGKLTTGTVVRVIDRIGLRLVVSGS